MKNMPSSGTEISAFILGGTGYGAGELLRYLVFHPQVKVRQVVSGSAVGEAVETHHPHLSGFYPELYFSEKLDLTGERCVIFSSLPHGKSYTALKEIEAAYPGVLLIDLSGDLRLRNESEHQNFYQEVPFDGVFRSRFRLSVPEISPPEDGHISNPGCLATAGALALWPLSNFKIEGTVTVDAKTGTSGAGRLPQANFHHPRRHANCEPYKVLSHRHEPEISELSGVSNLMFVPHILPTSRGIMATCYLQLADRLPESEILRRYQEAYAGAKFIRLRETPPSLQEVIGTNFCDISVHVRGRQIVAISVLDNLGKGMAGQAIQNMNIRLGLPEETGLMVPAIGV